MSTLTNYVVARCITQAAKYLETADSIEAGIVQGGSPVLKIDPDFKPSDEWVSAVRDLYTALSQNISDVVDRTPDEVDQEDVRPWADALDGDLMEPFGWAHRIINLMMHLRRLNGSSDLGDEEFNLIRRILRQP
ncbi:hypothetical protein [Geopseudomonas aromaticivorans]